VLPVVPRLPGRELRTRREFSLTSSFLGFVASPQLAGQALTTPGAEPWANRNTVIAISFFRFGLPPVDERAVPKRTSSGPGLPGSLGPECCASGRSVSVQGSLVRLEGNRPGRELPDGQRCSAEKRPRRRPRAPARLGARPHISRVLHGRPRRARCHHGAPAHAAGSACRPRLAAV